MANNRKLAALADRLDELASLLKEEWRQRELRTIGMTPQELAGLQQWRADFHRQFVVQKQQEAGRLLEEALQAGAFRGDTDAMQIVDAVQQDDAKRNADFAAMIVTENHGAREVAELTTRHRHQADEKRQTDLFLGLWQRWLPTKGHPYYVRRATLGYDYVDAFTAFAGQLRGDGTQRQPARQKGVSRLDAAIVLQAMSDDEQTDKEHRKAAHEMSQRWGKLRSIKWRSLVIGFDPNDRQCFLFDVGDLVTVLADREPKMVIQFGGESKLVAKLRKIAREPLPVEQSVKLMERTTTRTTCVSTKLKKTLASKRREKS